MGGLFAPNVRVGPANTAEKEVSAPQYWREIQVTRVHRFMARNYGWNSKFRGLVQEGFSPMETVLGPQCGRFPFGVA